ncbi:hypothetical protein OIM81_23065, partial [Escherichia coli]|nr:hypothetical protein [Escherichia coli]MCV8476910.1 hypothetical protein [Escherichia coli]MCV8531834.1 hypothetical protein [Escherichia coli]
TSIICSPMTSLKTSIKTITYLSDIGCLEIHGASLDIKSAVAFSNISFSISIRCRFFLSSRISICSGVIREAFGVLL